MTGAPAVVFDHVWKKFRRGERHDSLRDLVPSMIRRVLGGGRPSTELESQEFWALKDVSFEVHPGQALGIIGPNGAGKSTTLKLLTKILRPTTGHCHVRGRVGALIEVAAGFHPDLTGRENVFLQGTIMGMRPDEIRRQFDAIVDFSAMGEFIDTPVKRYSSGMNARLGFAIATHMNPEALIIDEVLSVGDMTFQERCMARMLEFKRDGVAIVFVSHNLQAISQLCGESVYLRNAVVAAGPTPQTIAKYISDRWTRAEGTSAAVDITGATLLDGDSEHRFVPPGTRLTLRVSYEGREELKDVTFGFSVHRSTDRLRVYDANLSGAQIGMPIIRPGDRFDIDFAFSVNLTRGHYQIGCHVYHGPTHSYPARLMNAASVTVEETVTFDGMAFLDLRPSLRLVEAPALVNART